MVLPTTTSWPDEWTVPNYGPLRNCTHARTFRIPYGLLPTDLVVLAAPYSVTLIVLKSEGKKKLMHDARSPRWPWSQWISLVWRWRRVTCPRVAVRQLLLNAFALCNATLRKKTGENILKSCCAHYISDDGNKSNTPARDALINIPCDQQRIPS